MEQKGMEWSEMNGNVITYAITVPGYMLEKELIGGGRVAYPLLHFLSVSAPCLCATICLERPVSAPYILTV